MKIDENETKKNQKRSNKLISHCFSSLDFENRKLKSKRNQNLIKNIIFMSSQFNLTCYFLRIDSSHWINALLVAGLKQLESRQYFLNEIILRNSNARL